MAALLPLRRRAGAPRVVPPRWGFEQETLARNGVRYRHLVVLPPGSTRRDLRLLRLRRECGWMTALLSSALLVGLSRGLGAGSASLLALIASVVILAATRHATGRVAARCRRLDVCTGPSIAPLPSSAASALHHDVLGSLREADRALRAGRITVVQHELTWHDAWEALEVVPPLRRRTER